MLGRETPFQALASVPVDATLTRQAIPKCGFYATLHRTDLAVVPGAVDDQKGGPDEHSKLKVRPASLEHHALRRAASKVLAQVENSEKVAGPGRNGKTSHGGRTSQAREEGRPSERERLRAREPDQAPTVDEVAGQRRTSIMSRTCAIPCSANPARAPG